MSKICGECGGEFPATSDFFNRDRSKKDGLRNQCKLCKQGKDRKRLHEQNEAINARRKELRLRPGRADILNARCKANYAIHGQKYNENKRKKQVSNPEYAERNRARSRAYRMRDREYYLAKERASYQKNIERRREHDRQRYEQRKPYYQSYRSMRPEVMRALDRRHSHKKRARKRNIPGEFTTAQIQEQLQRQHYRCYYLRCGQAKFLKDKKSPYGYHFQIEHIIPVSRTEYDPSNDMSNIVLSCESCNASKHDKLPHEWSEGGRLL